MFLICGILIIFIFALIITITKIHQRKDPQKTHVGFFHPHCDAGGGGERVLWAAVEALQTNYNFIECSIYSVPGLQKEVLINSVYTKFKIKIHPNINLVPLKSYFLLNKKYYPHFTVLAQNIASIFVGLEGIARLTPDIFIDTTGFPFTASCLALFSRSIRTAAYVHYPIVSSDMIARVQTGSNPWLKTLYYRLLMGAYGLVGGGSFDCVMVNSKWTLNHILELWGNSESTWLLYPPCATDEFSTLAQTRGSSQRFMVVSLAQFRPEKNLELQITALSELLSISSVPRDEVRLLLVGGVRNEQDKSLVEGLKTLAVDLGVEENVKFCENVSFEELKEILSSCSIGLHSMVDEHFGIGIVECMAAGLIMVAHNSGGPKLDIVLDEDVGFRADGSSDYAQKMGWIMSRSLEELDGVRRRARLWVCDHFSERIFRSNFIQIFDSTLLPG